MQSLAQAMNAVKAKAEIEQKSKPKEVDTKAPKSFHQLAREMKATDPENSALQQAIANGKARAAEFMASVYTMTHPEHEKNLKLFKNAYGMDAREAEENIVAQTCKEVGAAPYEMVDPAYEANVLNKYKPTGNVTHEKLALYNIFQTGMKEKWQERGYRGDKEYAEALASMYTMDPDNNTIEVRNFQPRD